MFFTSCFETYRFDGVHICLVPIIFFVCMLNFIYTCNVGMSRVISMHFLLNIFNCFAPAIWPRDVMISWKIKKLEFSKRSASFSISKSMLNKLRFVLLCGQVLIKDLKNFHVPYRTVFFLYHCLLYLSCHPSNIGTKDTKLKCKYFD